MIKHSEHSRFVGKDGREIFGMPTPDALPTDEIKGAPYYGGYQEHIAKYQQYLDAARGQAKEGGATKSPKAIKVTKPKAAKVTKPTAKRSKAGLVGKRRKAKSPLKLVDEPSDEGVPVEEPAYNEDEANLQRALELSLKEQRKGKEKVVDEQAAQDLLTLQTPKKKSPADQFIFQRRTPLPTEASGHAESPSLDRKLALTDSETESNNEVPKINTGDQNEGHARPNPGNQDKGQAGSNPGDQDEGQAGSNHGDAAESQPQSSHVVHAGPNL
ncbi:retrovirus-related pol polyprotein from transposon TNT 1-94 [Tanacetum coccineum]